MGCYAIPTLGAIIHSKLRKKNPKWRTNKYHQWLGLMMTGGAIFGLIDHLWNGELFLFGENIIMDLLLGVTITAVILVVWAILVVVDKASIKKPATN